MEEETNTRLIFPGAFAFITFSLFAFVFGKPCLNVIPQHWEIMLAALVTTIPAIGLFSDRVVRFAAGGYFGRRLPLRMRRLCSLRIRKLVTRYVVCGPWLSDARILAARRFGRPGHDNWQEVDSNLERLHDVHPDVLFALLSVGVLDKSMNAENNKIQMPEKLIGIGRRRWTVVWASWNIAFAMISAAIIYVFFFWPLPPIGNLRAGLFIFASMFLFFLFLIRVGWRNRRDAWDLELAWLVATIHEKELTQFTQAK